MELSNLYISSALALALLIIYRLIIFPLLFSALAKIPNAHWTAPLSSLWMLNQRRLLRDTLVLHQAHRRKGSILRIAPDEISVNSVNGGIRTIYGGGFEKGSWYENVFNNYGVQPMFTMSNHQLHSERKRLLSHVYAKSTILSSKALAGLTRILVKERLVSLLKEQAKQNPSEGLEMYHIFAATTLDMVSGYIFGLKNTSNFLVQPDLGKAFFQEFRARQGYTFWPQELPHFTSALTRIGLKRLLIPGWVDQSNRKLEAWLLAICDAASSDMKALGGSDLFNGKPEDFPTVYARLYRALQGNRLEIASECMDQVVAGYDTSTIALTFLTYEISQTRHRVWQEKLRAELTSTPTQDGKTLDTLPILHAIMMETLRLHAALAGGQPRITPSSATLGPYTNLPAGIRVQSQAWSLHRNPDVFPSPDSFEPGRWIDCSPEQEKEMLRWFWAFSSGGRMCVGSNLARYDIKAIVAAIWSNFRTELVEGEELEHSGGYMSPPVEKDGKHVCRIRMETL